VIELGPLPDEILERLLVKYETIASLRAARAGGAPHPDRSFFQALAAEFPGALKELDRLAPALLGARIAALRARQLEGIVWPWPVSVYHALLAIPDRPPWTALPWWLRAPAEPVAPSRMRCALMATARRLELSPLALERELFPWKLTTGRRAT
jgi:hypothetical protein